MRSRRCSSLDGFAAGLCRRVKHSGPERAAYPFAGRRVASGSSGVAEDGARRAQ